MKCYNNINLYYYIIKCIFINTSFLFHSHHIIEYNPDFIVVDFFKQIIFAGGLIDIFYVTHRARYKYLYKWSHKIHQDSKTIGMEAVYHHWFDLYFSNLLPIFMALWVLPSENIYTWYTWVFLATATQFYTHILDGVKLDMIIIINIQWFILELEFLWIKF